MIPAEYRRKGGALLLGARQPGDVGPFGAYGDEDQADEETTVPEAPGPVRTIHASTICRDLP
ncbi:hypothetical protein ACFYRL_17530 [Streptomyces goshikiensis]|uniref:hypothetical protein n=1 Tax=Streptomyces goshikiensis TaxID=1942 RepID=UPI003689A896